MRNRAFYFGATLMLGLVSLDANGQERSPWSPPQQATRSFQNRTITTPSVQARMGAGASSYARGNAVASSGSSAQMSHGSSVPVIVQTPNYVYIVPKAGSRMRMPPPVVQSVPGGGGGGGMVGGGAEVIVQQPDPAALNYLQSDPQPGVEEPEEPVAAPPVSPQQPSIPIFITPEVTPTPVVEVSAPTPPRERVQPISQAKGLPYNDNDPLLGYQQQQAEKGDPQAQYALGIRFLSGIGVDENWLLAREWLEKSSRNGNLRARSKLRELSR